MSRVLVLVEGQTERAVIDRVLAPFLGARGIGLHPRIIGKPGHKGGIRKFESIVREVRALLRQEAQSTVTTFFDYYALPNDWPGVLHSKGKPALEIPAILEPEIAEAIRGEFSDSFNPDRFIPYIQMYELEALLFSGPREMAEVFERPSLQPNFEQIVRECGGCEQIDDDPLTAPSKRIEQLHPAYRKGQSGLAHAPLILNRTGPERLRAACPHFDHWLTRLERLA